jgi:hypothetical protein
LLKKQGLLSKHSMQNRTTSFAGYWDCPHELKTGECAQLFRQLLSQRQFSEKGTNSGRIQEVDVTALPVFWIFIQILGLETGWHELIARNVAQPETAPKSFGRTRG